MLWQITVGLAILALSLWIRWRQKILRTFTELGIPGPKPNILFGNMLELYRKGPLKCQEEWIKKYGTTFGYYFGMKPVVVIADEESLKQVQIKEFQNFPDRPISLFRLQDGTPKGTNHLINQTGKEWKETRSLLSPAFTSGKLKQMASTMMDAIDVTMDLVEENATKNREFDIYRLWQGLTADVIGRTSLGIDVGIQRNQDHSLIRSARVLFSENSFQSLFFLIGFSFKEFGRAFFYARTLWLSLRNKMEDPVSNLRSGIAEVITNRRANNITRPDLLQSLMDAVKTEKTNNVDVNHLTATVDDLDEHQTITNGSPPSTEGAKKRLPFLTNDKVESNAIMMYLAGYETTSTALGFTTYVLVKYPEVQEKLRKEVQHLIEKEGELSSTSVQSLQYMDQVFTETLRVYPPIFSFVNREAVQDVKIKNYLIPKGMAVQVPVYWLHHNPDYWEDPERFDPSRFEKDTDVKSRLLWQPFGAGPRNCIGMRFALMEAKLAIAKLLLKYRLEPGERTDYKGDIRVRIALSILSPADGVHVRAIPLNR